MKQVADTFCPVCEMKNVKKWNGGGGKFILL